ncbi:angiopoietin-related protein 7-like [Saccostrea echinata]|uniref:angiopoietin-related protein 7-like n=1 Tax=Saccostrea echinata TaxID=191078 RepID=UPI002A837C66|nr:angiopoietin-related protein 7-like [Saccostrea echinata]
MILEDENKMLNDKLKGCYKSMEIHKNLSVGEISNREKEKAKLKVKLKTYPTKMKLDDFNKRLQMVEDNLNSFTISFDETMDNIKKDQITIEKRLLKITCDIFTATGMAFDCLELYNKGCFTGVYSIYPWGASKRSLRVLCDMETAGGGWTYVYLFDGMLMGYEG